MVILIVGGGAAGIMAAIAASENKEARIILVDKNEKLGKKLYITGKGRCNITNDCEVRELLENVVRNPKFLTSAIYRFPPAVFIDFLQSNGLKLKTERGRRVFPESDKSSDVIKFFNNILKKKKNVEIRFGMELKDIIFKGNAFCQAVFNDNECVFADKIILACGGASYPLTGSDGNIFKILSKNQIEIEPLRPALAPIILNKSSFYNNLEGLSLKNVEAKIIRNNKPIFSEFGEMLFTSEGVSGPIVLTLSSYINRIDLKGCMFSIDLKPALDMEKLDERIQREINGSPNKDIANMLRAMLPEKMIVPVLEQSKVTVKKCNQLSKSERSRLCGVMKDLRFPIERLDLLDRAIVTSGGVSVKEIDPSTMKSRKYPNLFIAGEMIDIDALTGGYNLHIAFSTGYVAGTHAAENIS